MYLQSDGSDRKKIYSRAITSASAVDECQTMSYPKVYSSAASLSGLKNCFYPIIMLDVIRTEP